MIISSVEKLLSKYNIRAKKRLGQNFLKAIPTIQKIVNSLEIQSDDYILEIGPGLGIMTAILAHKAKKVFAIEKDSQMANIAQQEFGYLKNIEIINKDFLKVDLKSNIFCHHEPCETRRADPINDSSLPRFARNDRRIKVIGNIPYNISTPIIFKILENRELFSSATLMLQKELASRITAKPNTKEYGILSILVQVQCVTKKLFDIKPTCFIPPPKVISTVIHLDFLKQNDYLSKIENFDIFKKIVKAAFSKRRKTIINSLINPSIPNLNKEKLYRALKKSKINPKTRAETLSIENFIELTQNLLDTNI